MSLLRVGGGGAGVAGEEYAIIIVIEVSLSYYVNDKSCYCERKKFQVHTV